jgi:predicted NBD/HSP70 family sugar kinase
MYYAGIDAHRSYLTVAIVDASGALVRERKRVLIGDGEPLLEALEGLVAPVVMSHFRRLKCPTFGSRR